MKMKKHILLFDLFGMKLTTANALCGALSDLHPDTAYTIYEGEGGVLVLRGEIIE